MMKTNCTYLVLILLLACNLSTADMAQAIVFEDVTAGAGIVGGGGSWGGAWGDYDNDGLLDLYTTGHVQERSGGKNQLWHNNGDGTFLDVSAATQLVSKSLDTHGATWADFDNDGDLDLYLSSEPLGQASPYFNYPNEFFRNNGDGTFSEIAQQIGVTPLLTRALPSRGCPAADYDLDGRLDLFVIAYGSRPKASDNENLLYHNDGNLVFTEIAKQAGLSHPDGIKRTAAWADYDSDGYPDLLLLPSCVLFKNQRDGTFVDVSASAGIAQSGQCQSAAWGDIDDDGHLDVYISNGYDQASPGILYRNNGNGTFNDMTAASGISNVAAGRGATWGDFDNDGDKDLYIVNSSNALYDNLLWQNNGDKTFTNVAAESAVSASSVAGSGADGSWVDYNNDGFLDLFITNGEGNGVGPFMLMKNPGNTNHWLKVKLKGTTSNTDGIMATMKVVTNQKSQYYTNTGPAHHTNQSSQPVHVGLGQETLVTQLQVTWPGGAQQTLDNLAADQSITLEEGKQFWSGAPKKLLGAGFYIWLDGTTWKVRWNGAAAGTNFSGKITATGSITNLKKSSLESTDSVTLSDPKSVVIAATEGNSGYDMITFTATGTLTFDLNKDGAAHPEQIFLGPQSVRPGALPVSIVSSILPPPAPQVTFADVSVAAGFTKQDNNSWGFAWADYNKDGFLDVLTHTHLQIVGDETNITQLWRNNGNGTFTDESYASGLTHWTGDTHGVVWSDLDKDGYTDFFVLNGSPKINSFQYNQIYHNNGNNTFTNVADSDEEIGIRHRGRGAAAVDYNVDGQLDLFVCAYDRGPGDEGNQLLTNSGNLVFADLAVQAGIDLPLNQNRTVSWGDFNNDGFPDFIIMPPCALFKNKGDGTFMEVTASAGIAQETQCTTAAWADYNDDGNVDLYISRGFDVPFPDILYKNNGNETFTDVTAASGINNSAMARAATWGDYDNDGDKDIYVVNFDNSREDNRFYRNNSDGTFTNVAAENGTLGLNLGGGSDGSFIDYDNDGDLDLFVANGEANTTGPYQLLNNQGTSGHWLEMNLQGVTSNANGIMAKIKLGTDQKTQYYNYNGPEHFMSQSVMPVHMGLGTEKIAKFIQVKWPNGTQQVIDNIAADQKFTLVEGQSLYKGPPQNMSRAGYYIWREGSKWKVKWIGGPAGNQFSGQLTTNGGTISNLQSAGLEQTDTVTNNPTSITFSASEGEVGDDLLSFSATGRVTFDIYQDAAQHPEAVFIGEQGIHPGSLPLSVGSSVPAQ